MPTPAVDVCDVRKTYGATTALDGLSLQAPAGAITALLGRNGAGKSTTVAICTGQLEPQSGRVTVLGEAPRQRSLRSRVGVMPQAAGSGAAGVYPSARVEEVARLFASFAAHPLDPTALLERLDLGRLARRTWRQLSGGEQQRVSFALALIGRPELVFLDEPSAGLDVHARHAIWALLGEMRAAGVTVVLATHSMDEAERLADHLVVIDRGRSVAAGSVAELAAGDASRLTFRARPGLPLPDLSSALPAGVAAAEPSPGHYVVIGGADAQIVAAVTAWCAANDVLAERISTERRSLEEVFLELTGGPG